MKNISQKLVYRFLVESTTIESRTFPFKNELPKAMLRQIEWGVQNGPITINTDLP